LHPFPATAFAVLGALLIALLGDPRAHAYAFAALALAWGLPIAAAAPRTGRPASVAIAALLVRLPLLAVVPTLSDDVYRYLWEGEVWRAGFNPFVLAPDAPALAPLRDAVWAQVNHRSVPTVYPPLAQALFVALSGGGVFAWRLLSAACDVGTAWLLARARPGAGWVWALLPLPALESAVSGHLEGIGVCLFVAALIQPSRGLFAWLGAMVKLLPGVLILREPPRRWFGWAALTLAVTLPIVRTEGFETYRATWAYNGSLFPLAEALLGEHARAALQGLGAVLVGGILLWSRDRGRVALWTTGAFVLLSPTVHPWYALWPLAAGLFTGSRAWTLLGALLPWSYTVLATYDPATSSWTESPTTRLVVYVPFYLALLAEAWTRLTRAGPASVA
jgi:hypothetical protein